MSNPETKKEPVTLNFLSGIVRDEISGMFGVKLEPVKSEEGDFGHKELWQLDDGSMTVIHYPRLGMLIVGVSDLVGNDIKTERFQKLKEKYGDHFFDDDNLWLEGATFSICAWGKEENRDLVSKSFPDMYLMESENKAATRVDFDEQHLLRVAGQSLILSEGGERQSDR